MSQLRDRLGYLGFLVVGLTAFWMALDFSFESSIFPRMIAGLMAVIAGLHLLASFRPSDAGAKAGDDAADGYQLESSGGGFFDDPRRFAIIFGLSLVYCLSIGVVGYYTSTIVFVPVAALALGFRNLPIIALSTAIYVAVTYLVINVAFSRVLPPELPLQFFR